MSEKIEVQAEVDLTEHLMDNYDNDCQPGEYYQATALRVIKDLERQLDEAKKKHEAWILFGGDEDTEAKLRARIARMEDIGKAYLKDLVEGRVYILSGTPEQIKEYDDRIKEVREALPSEGENAAEEQ